MRICNLSRKHTSEVHSFIAEATNDISDVKFIKDTVEQLSGLLSENLSYGIRNKGLLAGVVLCYLKDLDIFLDTIVVSKDHRGKKLSIKLIEKVLSKNKVVYTMVSPLNYISILNFNNRGFKLHKTIVYNNVSRLILVNENIRK